MRIYKEDVNNRVVYNQMTLLKGFKGELHWHDRVEICRVTEGGCDFMVGGHTYVAEAGDMVIIRSGELHRFILRGDICRLELCLFCASSLFEQMSRVPFLRTFILRRELESVSGLATNLEIVWLNLCQEQKQADEWMTEVMLAQVVWLWCLLARSFTINTPVSAKSLRQLQPVLDDIALHYPEELNLRVLARRWGYTPDYLSALFRRCVGIGFKSYLNNLRIHAACRLLVDTNETVTSIAGLCGFANIRTFNALFRRIVGDTPSAFRLAQASGGTGSICTDEMHGNFSGNV